MRERILAGLLVFVAGCQTSGEPLSLNRRASAEAEALAGRRAASSLESQYGGTVHDATAQRRMDTAVHRLAAGRSELDRVWHCHLLASDHVNAFSLPGELIYVSRGLYERIGDDEDLLTAIIAHEMAHVMSRDSFKHAATTPEQSLAREVNADGQAVEYLAASGCGPRSLVRLLKLVNDVQPGGWSDIRARHANHRIESLPDHAAVTLAVR